MINLHGMRIIESPMIQPVPRMQVSDEFKRLQSPELVAETNRWMLEFFGTYLPTYVMDGAALGLSCGKVVAMHPSQIAVLRTKA